MTALKVNEKIADQVTQLLNQGDIVNLGIGIPGLVADRVTDCAFVLQAETGVVGYQRAQKDITESIASDNNQWSVDRDYIDASGQAISPISGGAYMTLSDTFAVMRGGHIDVTVLGAYQVNQYGKIASIGRSSDDLRGFGGAMDLLFGAKKVIVAMTHANRNGQSKIVPELSFPITSTRAVDLVVTELGVFSFTDGKLNVVSYASRVTLQDVIALTDIPVIDTKPSQMEGGV